MCWCMFGPEARFWGAFAFRGQLPENPGVCLWSYPGGLDGLLIVVKGVHVVVPNSPLRVIIMIATKGVSVTMTAGNSMTDLGREGGRRDGEGGRRDGKGGRDGGREKGGRRPGGTCVRKGGREGGGREGCT